MCFLGSIHLDQTVLTEEGGDEQDEEEKTQGDDNQAFSKMSLNFLLFALQEMAPIPDLMSLSNSFLELASP